MAYYKMINDNTVDYNGMNLTTAELDVYLQRIPVTERLMIDELHAVNNQLTEIPESILLLKNLKRLYLYTNCIQHIPEWIGMLTSLNTLNVRYNKIQTLPRSIGNLVNLELLYLTDHNLSSIPSSIHKLTKLSYIDTHGSHLLPWQFRFHHSNDYARTQQAIFDIACEEWKKRCQTAIVTWILVGKNIRLHKDIVQLIARLVFDSRTNGVWEE